MFFKMLKNMFGAKSCEKQISDKAADKYENVEVNKNKENTKSGFQNGYYTRSLTIDSILGKRVVVIAIIRNDYLVYDNCYNSSDYEYDEDGDMKFKGPVFKIELSLRNCDQFSIFMEL